MTEKIKARWEVSGGGDIEIHPEDVEGMSDAEIEDYIYNGAEMEWLDQGGWSIRLSGVGDAIRRVREALAKKGDADAGAE